MKGDGDFWKWLWKVLVELFYSDQERGVEEGPLPVGNVVGQVNLGAPIPNVDLENGRIVFR